MSLQLINYLYEISLFFDNDIIYVGGLIDALEIDWPIKDIDLIVDKNLFYSKFSCNYKKWEINYNNFYLKKIGAGIFAHTNIGVYQGLYKNKIKVDIFLVDKLSNSKNDMFLIQQRVFNNHRLKEFLPNQYLKISNVKDRLDSLKYMIDIDLKIIKEDWQKKWLIAKKKIIPKKIKKYLQKYPEFLSEYRDYTL